MVSQDTGFYEASGEAYEDLLAEHAPNDEQSPYLLLALLGEEVGKVNQAVVHATPNIALDKIARTTAVLHCLYRRIQSMSDDEMVIEALRLQERSTEQQRETAHAESSTEAPGRV